MDLFPITFLIAVGVVFMGFFIGGAGHHFLVERPRRRRVEHDLSDYDDRYVAESKYHTWLRDNHPTSLEQFYAQFRVPDSWYGDPITAVRWNQHREEYITSSSEPS